jgi:L-seryl-tRNA(Ser) seleniumtransferase
VPAARDLTGRLRVLPSVEEVAARLRAEHGVAHAAAVSAAIGARRAELTGGASAVGGGNGAAPADAGASTRDAEHDVVVADAAARAAAAGRPHLRRVINATGVIVHTNLGRAPLSPTAIDAVAAAAEGYSNLEYDLDAGRRGSRQAHLEDLLRELTDAEAALAVNNCAAAALLACAALAAGREVVVSRGQLVEIGGSFRVLDPLRLSVRVRETQCPHV